MILEHYESFFGTIVRGWNSRIVPGVSVAEFAADECTILGTVGLSRYKSASLAGRENRQELVMMWRGNVTGADVTPVLLGLCQRVVEYAPILHGEIVDLGSSISHNFDKRYLFATVPAFLPEAFSVCELKDDGLALFCWMLPISEMEVRCVRRLGWDRFEERLEGISSGLLDVERDELQVEE